jgi:hypothetical protein
VSVSDQDNVSRVGHEESVETVQVLHGHDHESIPAPTSAPIMFAFGTTLLFAGLVTSPLVSIVGALCFFKGIHGWWFEVLPRESMEPIPESGYRVIDTGPEPGVATEKSARSAAHSATPRRILPVEIPRVRSGILGGLGGAIAMAVVALTWGATNYTIWMPINLRAAMVLETFNTEDVQSLSAFSVSGLATATAIHLSMSIMVGLVLASLIPMAIGWPRIFSIVVAPFTWSLFTYGAMGVLDPTLEKWVDWYWFVGSQVAFGAVCGFLIARSERIETIQFMTPSERIGLEKTHDHHDSRGGSSS